MKGENHRPRPFPDVSNAVDLINAGHIVGYPTETLYGLAADALNEDALARLMRVKRRELSHHIPVLVADQEMLRRIVAHVPSPALALMEQHWPGPLTLVLPARGGLPAVLVNEQGGIGVRISSDPVAGALVRCVGRPITATSANLSQQQPATTADQANLAGVSLVLDDGPRAELASTVVEVYEQPRILRQGSIRI